MHRQLARDVKDNDKNKPGDGWAKVVWKNAPRLWYVVPRNSQYELTVSSTILTKLLSQTFVGCLVKWDYISYSEWMWQTCSKRVQIEAWWCRKVCTLTVLWEVM